MLGRTLDGARMTTVDSLIRLPWGRVAVRDTQGDGPTLLMLHGSGLSRDVFVRQFDSELSERFRLVAIDLPGHGASSDAVEPATTYTISGLADCVSDVLEAIGVERAAVLGWPLGGHVAIDLLARHAQVAGLMLVGAPPVGRGPIAMLRGFQTHRDMGLAAKSVYSLRDIERFAHLCFGDSAPQHFLDLIARADGRVRTTIFMSMLRGEGVDQRQLVEDAAVPIATVNGADEPVARLSYVAALAYGTPWRSPSVIGGAGHAPFWDQPKVFNALLADFLADVELAEIARLQATGLRPARSA
jgi:pimeloyl-ACP methyl ester carboxylesterase